VFAASLAAAWLSLGSTSAAAEPDGYTLLWDAPEGCPTRREVRASIDAALPGPSPGLRQVELSVQRGWSIAIEVELDRGRGTRTLQGHSCAALVDGAAAVIAVAVEIGGLAAANGSQPGPSPAARSYRGPSAVPAPPSAIASDGPSASPAAPEPSDRASRRPDRRDSAVRLVVGGLLGASLPALERPTGAFFAHGGVRGRAWSALLTGGYRLAWDESIPGSDAAGRFDAWSLGARGCGIPGRGRFEAPLCGGIEAGQVRGAGRGEVTTAREQQSPWLAGVVTVAGRFRVHPRVAIGLALDTLFVPLRARFRIVGAGTACCSSRVIFQPGATIAVDLTVPRAR